HSVVTGISHWYQVIRQTAKFFHLLCGFERSSVSPFGRTSAALLAQFCHSGRPKHRLAASSTIRFGCVPRKNVSCCASFVLAPLSLLTHLSSFFFHEPPS